MKKRDWLIIVCVILLAAGVLTVSMLLPRQVTATGPVSFTMEGAETEMDAAAAAAGGNALWLLGEQSHDFSWENCSVQKAESYLILWFGSRFRAVPLTKALAGQQITVYQNERADYNTVTLMENSFNMTDASCPDHVCLTEGEVTLDNRDSRILQSYIFCLPNSIVLELVTRDELGLMLAQAVQVTK